MSDAARDPAEEQIPLAKLTPSGKQRVAATLRALQDAKAEREKAKCAVKGGLGGSFVEVPDTVGRDKNAAVKSAGDSSQIGGTPAAPTDEQIMEVLRRTKGSTKRHRPDLFQPPAAQSADATKAEAPRTTVDGPQPQNFGITGEEVAQLRRLRSKMDGFFTWQWRVCIGAGVIAGIYVGRNAKRLFGLALFVFAFAVICIVAGFVLALAFNSIWGWGLRGRFRQLAAYERAVHNYEQETRAFWLSLDGRSFELELARVYQDCGYSVHITGAAGDQGVDIELRIDGKTTVVQCKAHAKPIGPAKARELYGAMLHCQADAAILASLAGFTPGVLTFVAGKPIQLLDLDGILEIQKRGRAADGSVQR